MLKPHRQSLSPELPMDVQLLQSTSVALWWASLLLLTALAVGWVAQHSMWSFKQIEIKGDLEHNGAATIRAHAIPLLKGNFFTLNLDQARQAFKTVPWIRDAQVRRIWPGTLEVELREHQAIAHWKKNMPPSSKWPRPESHTSATSALVNHHGEIFYANADDIEDEQLPLFIGDEDRVGEMWSTYRKLLPIVAPLGQAQIGQPTAEISQLRLSPRGSWSVQMSNQLEIEMGRGTLQEILNRCARFMQSVLSVTVANQLKWRYADLRYPQGYALQIVQTNTKTQ